jgi:hypothetical protein
MDRFSSHVKRFAKFFFQSFAVGLLIGLVLVASQASRTARADVPNFPSPHQPCNQHYSPTGATTIHRDSTTLPTLTRSG